jgi:hypothetical protein
MDDDDPVRLLHRGLVSRPQGPEADRIVHLTRSFNPADISGRNLWLVVSRSL